MITQSELMELLDYDPDTGVFTWKKKTARRVKIGDVAGYLANGYIIISINRKNYYAHRLAWLYVYGCWPEFIDHINHIRNDNRIINMRNVTNQENPKNATLRKDNKSGVCGVYKCKAAVKWGAQIRYNGKNRHLGFFNDIEDAIAARNEAEVKYGFHENHGRI